MPAIPLKAFVTTAVVVVLLPTQAAATTVPRLDLPELVHSAELIVHGSVVRHWSDWDQAHHFIWTHYLLDVKDAFKGHSSTRVIISEPGGAAHGLITKIEGVTEYYDGEEVVVFLQRTPIGYWRCFGWGQGKYTVSQAAGGAKRIHANLMGLVFQGGSRQADGQGSRFKTSLTELNGKTFEEFKRLVLREVNR